MTEPDGIGCNGRFEAFVMKKERIDLKNGSLQVRVGGLRAVFMKENTILGFC